MSSKLSVWSVLLSLASVWSSVTLAQGSTDPCGVQFWDCNEQGVASLNGDALVALIPTFFGSIRQLQADFSPNPAIKHVEIHANVPLDIQSFEGSKLESISIKENKKLILKDLCIFALPSLANLQKVIVENSHIESFQYDQLKDCLRPRNGFTPQTQLEFRNVTIQMDRTKSLRKLTIYDSPMLKTLSMQNVTFKDFDRKMLVISKPLINKFKGNDMFFAFDSNPSSTTSKCGCSFESGPNGNLECVDPDDCPADEQDDDEDDDDDVTNTETPSATTSASVTNPPMPITASNTTSDASSCFKTASISFSGLSLVFATLKIMG